MSIELEKEAIELYEDDDEVETEDNEKNTNYFKKVSLLYTFNIINILIISRKWL